MTEEHYQELCRFEREAAAQGCRILGGVDEAGRGPLAGPVVAACVLFPAEGPFPKADDSKKLTPKKREAIFEDIYSSALGVGVGICDSLIIDRDNILQATYRAMRQAVEQAILMAGCTPDVLLMDHVHVPGLGIPQESITHGDALSVSIGAASIIAKVTRDRMMEEYEKVYPGYGFAKHKGYGTKAHYEAMEKLGLSPIHRLSFCGKVKLP